ncbi:cobalt ECF transporter T component CbiQ [Proteocatella sphenisci]|uniref:cobalt ECF transporter T component CbiQ n=1 Tax=Proteocatella sphenisci TaxID=181070 RepID=UPI000491DA6C|nr:cobalt ECF transporter T component CbiQ [Proteocatella sphenisci]
MSGTDRYAYASKVRSSDPVTKILVSLGMMFICIVLDDILVSLVTIVAMSACNMWMGGHRARDIWRMLRIPMGFIFLGVITIAVGRYDPSANLIAGFKAGNHLYGISQKGALEAISISAKSLGVISSVYFLVMNTPMTDITLALSKMHVPALFVELLELVYRFIFVLADTAEKIKTAQSSRLGYVDMKTSYRSTADLISRVFMSSFRKADNIYDALESRGYTGELRTVGYEYEIDTNITFVAIAVALLQIGAYMI